MGGKLRETVILCYPIRRVTLTTTIKKIDALHTFTVAVPSDVKQLVSRRQTLLDSTAGSSQRGKKKPKRLSKGFSCISRGRKEVAENEIPLHNFDHKVLGRKVPSSSVGRFLI